MIKAVTVLDITFLNLGQAELWNRCLNSQQAGTNREHVQYCNLDWDFCLKPSTQRVSQLKGSWITLLNLNNQNSMQTGLSVTKWYTECLTLTFINAEFYIRSWDIMPSTGILFVIYVRCLGLWRTPPASWSGYHKLSGIPQTAENDTNGLIYLPTHSCK